MWKFPKAAYNSNKQQHNVYVTSSWSKQNYAFIEASLYAARQQWINFDLFLTMKSLIYYIVKNGIIVKSNQHHIHEFMR